MKTLKIIMAGGRSTRMDVEKPVLKVNGIPLLLRAYKACQEAYIAVSRHTPKTKKLCTDKDIPIIETPGKGYVEDVKWLLEEYGPFVSVASDIPFITKKDLNEIDDYFRNNPLSLTGYVSQEDVPDEANPETYMGKCIVGINTVTHREEELFKLSNPYLAFNVNSQHDLTVANKWAKELDPVLY
ncbi:MAG: NTP transferase domain-containing protein [Archaeoglobaceae archaeon]